MDKKWKVLLSAGVILAFVVSAVALRASGGVYQALGTSHYTSDISMSSADIYLEGNQLYLDADDDTSITADTDDQIDVEISGADDFQFTANTFTALAGSTIALPATSDITAHGYVAVGDGTPNGAVTAGNDEELYVEGELEVDGELEADGVIDADAGLTVDGGVTNIGGGTPDVAAGDNDLFVTGDLEVDGELELDGTVDVDAVMTGLDDLEHIFFPTVASTAFTYTAAAGGTVVLFTIGAGEIWIVHDIYVNVTTNFDCTDSDCIIDIGDGGDIDGLCDLDDAELQTTDTEMTGAPAGWQCWGADTIGAYITSGRGFIYAPGSEETIDAVIDETSGETYSAGAATAYIIYTRIQ